MWCPWVDARGIKRGPTGPIGKRPKGTINNFSVVKERCCQMARQGQVVSVHNDAPPWVSSVAVMLRLDPERPWLHV